MQPNRAGICTWMKHTLALPLPFFASFAFFPFAACSASAAPPAAGGGGGGGASAFWAGSPPLAPAPTLFAWSLAIGKLS
jgi:hypothetical protein